MTDVLNLLCRLPLFEELEPEELESLAPLFSKRLYQRGTVIYWQGDPADEFFIVKSGLVKFCILNDEKEIILELFPEGSYFGDMAIFLKDMQRSANTEAVETTVAYALSRSALTSFLEQYPQVTVKLLSNMAERYRRAAELIESLTVLDVRRRFYRLLLRLAEEHGVHEDRQVTLSVRLTHLQLANMIGTVRETVTKMMSELQEEEIVSVHNKLIVLLDVPRLRSKFTCQTERKK